MTTRVILLEEVLLVAFAAPWYVGKGLSSDQLLYGLIVLSAVAMGMQSAAAYDIGVPGITTTYFTGTLTNIVAGAIGRSRPAQAATLASCRVRWPASAFLAYVSGAAVTGFLQLHPTPMLAAVPALGLPALPAVVIAVVLLLAFLDEAFGLRGAKKAR